MSRDKKAPRTAQAGGGERLFSAALLQQAPFVALPKVFQDQLLRSSDAELAERVERSRLQLADGGKSELKAHEVICELTSAVIAFRLMQRVEADSRASLKGHALRRAAPEGGAA